METHNTIKETGASLREHMRSTCSFDTGCSRCPSRPGGQSTAINAAHCEPHGSKLSSTVARAGRRRIEATRASLSMGFQPNKFLESQRTACRCQPEVWSADIGAHALIDGHQWPCVGAGCVASLPRVILRSRVSMARLSSRPGPRARTQYQQRVARRTPLLPWLHDSASCAFNYFCTKIFMFIGFALKI